MNRTFSPRHRFAAPLGALALTLTQTTASADLSVVEQQVLTQPENTQFFGSAVALDGPWLVVGARNELEAGVGQAGAAYTYSFDGTNWIPGQRLVSSQVEDDGQFGTSAALVGDWLAIGQINSGQQGSVHLFRLTGSTWTFDQAVAGDTSSWDEFGFAVDLAGDRLAVGAMRDTSSGPISGAAYVFRLEEGVWVKEAVLHVPEPESLDWMGYDLDFDGSDRLIVGAYGYAPAGSAFVFERSGTTWTQTAQLDGPSFGFIGFGTAVELEGDTAIVGATSDDTAMGTNSGSVYVHRHDGSSWQVVQQLVPPAPTTAFGAELELAGGLLFVDEIDLTHEVHAYGLQPSGWTLFDAATTALAGNNVFGWSIALSNGRLVVSAPWQMAPQVVYVFDLQTDQAESYCTAGTSASGCAAQASTAGQASASSSGSFELLVSNVEGSKQGLFYWGANGRQANPWGSSTSYQCVVPPVARGALLQENGTQGACDGAYTYDLHDRWTAKPATNPGVGAVVQAQFWYRDPLGNSLGTSISDAVEFTVGP